MQNAACDLSSSTKGHWIALYLYTITRVKNGGARHFYYEKPLSRAIDILLEKALY